MRILKWESPEEIMSQEEWNELFPERVSELEAKRAGKVLSDGKMIVWSAKLTIKNINQVTIRFNNRFGQTIIVVGLHGYNYKTYRTSKGTPIGKRYFGSTYTDNLNVHIATNGPIQLTFEEVEEMRFAILEAKKVLEKLKNGSKKTVVSKGRQAKN